jgi:hypothetical protein
MTSSHVTALARVALLLSGESLIAITHYPLEQTGDIPGDDCHSETALPFLFYMDRAKNPSSLWMVFPLSR